MKKNERKATVLSVLLERQRTDAANPWMSVQEIARRAGLRPHRRAYPYLQHLCDMGLLIRGKARRTSARPQVLIFYRIATAGQKRLEWLARQGGN